MRSTSESVTGLKQMYTSAKTVFQANNIAAVCNLGVESIASDPKGPDFTAMFGEELQRLAWALAKLPYKQRETLLLHVYSGMKFREIAMLSGESINTLKGRYRYGLDKLRTLLNSEVKNETG